MAVPSPVGDVKYSVPISTFVLNIDTQIKCIFFFCFSILIFLISKVQKILTLGIPLLLDKVPSFRSTAENIIIVGENIQ